MIVDALRKKYEHEILSARANIDVYLKNPAGDSEMEKLASAEDKVNSLNANFHSNSTNPQILTEQRSLDFS